MIRAGGERRGEVGQERAAAASRGGEGRSSKGRACVRRKWEWQQLEHMEMDNHIIVEVELSPQRNEIS